MGRGVFFLGFHFTFYRCCTYGTFIAARGIGHIVPTGCQIIIVGQYGSATYALCGGAIFIGAGELIETIGTIDFL